MGGLLEYSGIATKIRGMHAKLLKPVDYENMAGKSNVTEVLSYLMDIKAYKEVFSEVSDPGSLHRDDIEHYLLKTVFDDYDKIYRFSGSSQRCFLESFFLRYEVFIIKICLRNIFGTRGTDNKNIRIYKDFFYKRSKLDITRLYESESINDLIEKLAGTGFYSVMKLLRNNSDATLFDYESLLDIFLFKSLWRSCHKNLSKSDLSVIKELYGEQIDLLNLQWIYRARKHYNFSDVQIFSILIPVFYKINKDTVLSLIRAGDKYEFDEVFSKLYYARHVNDINNLDIEQLYKNRMDKLYRMSLKKNPHSIACIASYIYFKQEEVNNLTRLIECVRYSKNKEYILYKDDRGVKA